MSISRIQAIETDNNVPKVDIDSTENNVPKFPVDLQGGSEPIIESLSITENGTYTPEQGVDGFSPVIVDVPTPQPVLQGLNVTENGTYTPEEGIDGFNQVVVDVPPVEPTTKVVSEFDFSVSEYDLIRSINPTDPSPEHKALMNIYKYNASYDSQNGVITWNNGYGNIEPVYSFEPFKDYDIDIEMGNVSSSESGERQFLGIGLQITLYWNNSGYVRRGNSSGSETWTDIDSIDYISNNTLKVRCRWALSNLYEPTSYWNISFDGGTTWKFLGNVEYKAYNGLIVGRSTSSDGIYPAQVKGVKIIEKVWELAPSE